jgi:hypothetical protein
VGAKASPIEKADLEISIPDANVPVALRKFLLLYIWLVDIFKIKY